MDPEDLREVISAYQKCVAETVQRFGGFVAKYMGDGVLVYVGYPQAHEDDAERAVRAGLELVVSTITREVIIWIALESSPVTVDTQPSMIIPFRRPSDQFIWVRRRCGVVSPAQPCWWAAMGAAKHSPFGAPPLCRATVSCCPVNGSGRVG
jgi:hypothetical protein